MRAAYGIDEPLPQQYLRWLGRLLTGDFGRSSIYKRPVIQMIGATLPNTLQLSALALRWRCGRRAAGDCWRHCAVARSWIKRSACCSVAGTRSRRSGSG